tara:strand:+ start:359 stop:667 length:309 start_codon:yes stop_codon:yes gene_type:complete
MVRRSVSISFQDHILQMLDELATNIGTNRSQVIQNMISKEYGALHTMTFGGVGVTTCLHPEQMAEYGMCNPFHRRRCMNCYPSIASLEEAKKDWKELMLSLK